MISKGTFSKKNISKTAVETRKPFNYRNVRKPYLNITKNEKNVAKSRKQILAEESIRKNNLKLIKINGARINCYSLETMKKVTRGINITSEKIDGDNDDELADTVNDPHLGRVTVKKTCMQCYLYDCPGHYGLIEFDKCSYFPNTLFTKEIIQVLQSVCNYCSRILVSKLTLKNKGILDLPRSQRLKEIAKLCKDKDCCHKGGEGRYYQCDDDEKIKISKNCGVNPKFDSKMSNKEGFIIFKKRFSKYENDIGVNKENYYAYSGNHVFTILDRITKDDLECLGFSEYSHPRNSIMRGVLVISEQARAPTFEGKPKLEPDPLTYKYSAIVSRNNSILNDENMKNNFNDPIINFSELKSRIKDNYKGKGEKKEKKIDGAASYIKKVTDLYNAHVALIKPKTDKNKNKTNNKMNNYKTIWDRLQGKDALFRNGLMSKRNDCCARTVASPDPDIDIDEFSIPSNWTKILKKPVDVTRFNIDFLQKLLREQHISEITSSITKISFSTAKNYKTYKLKIGDLVYRDLMKGDRVLVNRQPSIIKYSSTSLKIVPKDRCTVGLPLPDTAGLNADFDGDELNLWVPQDLVVISELDYIVNIRRNIMSTGNNSPNVGLVMNGVTGSYMMTAENNIIDRKIFKECYNLIKYKKYCQDLNERLELHGVHPLSGQALYSTLFPPDFYYERQKGTKNHVLISQGVLVKGRLDKKHIGRSGGSIIQELHKEYGYKVAFNFINDACKVIDHYIGIYGFTVGIKDCNIGKQKEIKSIIEEAYFKVQSLDINNNDSKNISKYKEMKCCEYLNISKSHGDKFTSESLQNGNSIAMMVSGAKVKGQIANFSQITTLVGQQYKLGERFKYNIDNNTKCLPYFDRNSTNPEARGFVANSYYSGLTPPELWFIHAACRENLTDTSIKTAETGTIERMLVKSIENLIYQYDGTLRSTDGFIYQICYNAGYNPASLVMVNDPEIEENCFFINLKQVCDKISNSLGWLDKDNYEYIKNKRKELQELKSKSEIKPIKFKKFNKKFIPKDFSNCNRGYEDPRGRKITIFELAKLVGCRSKQLSLDDDPLVDLNGLMDPHEIAKKEVKSGKLKLYVRRNLPNGKVEILYPTLDNLDISIL